jgi:hypothetical protein
MKHAFCIAAEYVCLPNLLVCVSAGPIPLRIREARVPIVNDNECVRKINSVTEKIFILPASSFCAGGEKGHDACQVKKCAKKTREMFVFSRNSVRKQISSYPTCPQ